MANDKNRVSVTGLTTAERAFVNDVIDSTAAQREVAVTKAQRSAITESVRRRKGLIETGNSNLRTGNLTTAAIRDIALAELP